MQKAKNTRQKISVLRWNSSPYTKMAHEYVINIKKGEKSRNEALRRLGSEEIEKMERHFKILSAAQVFFCEKKEKIYLRCP